MAVALSAMAFTCECDAADLTVHTWTTLDVQVTQLTSSNGTLLVNLYTSEDGFPSQPEKAFRRATVSAQTPYCTFAGIPAGIYAVAVCHDENGNGKCDLNFLGIPKEGVGATNGEKGLHGPPRFEKAVFKVTEENNKVVIALNY